MSEQTGVGRGASNADPVGTGDLVAGLAVVCFGAAILVHVRGFPEMPGGAPGPALFPGILGGLLVLFGGVLVGRWLLHRGPLAGAGAGGDAEAGARREGGRPDDQEGGRSSTPLSTAWLNALSVLGAVLFYLMLSEVLGFPVTMTLTLFGLSWRLGARPLSALLAASVTTVVLYVLFQRVLLVPLPAGLLG